MTDHRLTAERALKEITAALDTIAATITAALDNLATVDAPASTLAEELRDMLEARDREDPTSFSGLLARVEQVEQERDEAKKERDHFFREVENVRNWKEGLLNERDEARAEVERLDAVAEDYARRATAALTERDEARAEVKRLTAQVARQQQIMKLHGVPRDTVVLTAERLDRNPETKARVEAALNNLDQVEKVAVQKGAESNAETPDPADVKPGEAWLIGRPGAPSIGVRNCPHTDFPWTVVEDEGHVRVMDSGIVLRSRLVPAPRVITDLDELDRAKRNTVIHDGVGVVCERAPLGDGWFTTGNGVDQTPYIQFPATVLWEPGA